MVVNLFHGLKYFHILLTPNLYLQSESLLWTLDCIPNFLVNTFICMCSRHLKASWLHPSKTTSPLVFPILSEWQFLLFHLLKLLGNLSWLVFSANTPYLIHQHVLSGYHPRYCISYLDYYKEPTHLIVSTLEFLILFSTQQSLKKATFKMNIRLHYSLCSKFSNGSLSRKAKILIMT